MSRQTSHEVTHENTGHLYLLNNARGSALHESRTSTANCCIAEIGGGDISLQEIDQGETVRLKCGLDIRRADVEPNKKCIMKVLVEPSSKPRTMRIKYTKLSRADPLHPNYDLQVFEGKERDLRQVKQTF